MAEYVYKLPMSPRARARAVRAPAPTRYQEWVQGRSHYAEDGSHMCRVHQRFLGAPKRALEAILPIGTELAAADYAPFSVEAAAASPTWSLRAVDGVRTLTAPNAPNAALLDHGRASAAA